MADRYWVGGTDNWDGNVGTKWSTTSGGAGGASIPTFADDVYFDAASGAVTVTVPGNSVSFRNLNCTGFTGSLIGTSGSVFNSYGNITTGAGMAAFSGYRLIFEGAVNHQITSNGITFSFSDYVQQNVTGITVTLLDNLKVVGGNFYLYRGTLNLNNNSLTYDGTLFQIATQFTTVLAFGSTGKLILDKACNLDLISSGGVYPNLSFTGSKEVYLAGASGTYTLERGSSSLNQQLNYITTATCSATVQFSGFNSVDSIDFSLGSPTLVLNQGGTSWPLEVYGNFILGPSVTISTPVSFRSISFIATSGTKIINTSGVNMKSCAMDFSPSASVTYNLQSNLVQDPVSGARIGIFAGTFNTNNYSITTSFLRTGGTSTVNLGSSAINSYGIADFIESNYIVRIGAGTTLNAGTSTINAINTVASFFSGGGKTFYNFNKLSGAGQVTMLDSNTFNNISNTITPTTFRFAPSTTTTINNQFQIAGTSGNLATINSSSPGTKFNISRSSGLISVNYLAYQDSNATGGAVWQALASNGNVDLGNNTGWVSDPNAIYVEVTGVSSSGSVGTATTATTTNANVVGVEGIGQVGDVTIFTEGNINVNVFGVSATCQPGDLFFFRWNAVNDGQNPNWSPVNDSQAQSWATINTNSAPVWSNVTT